MLALGGCSDGTDRGGVTANPSATPAPAAQAPPPAQTAIAAPRTAISEPPTAPVAQLSCAPCRKLAFTSSRDGNDEIYTVNADGTGITRLTHDAASDDHAAWSPDGARLAFTSHVGDDSDLIVINADGSGAFRHRLPHRAYYPTWSADGTKIAYAALSDGSLNLWTVDANGGYPLSLLAAPGWDGHPAWSPDGTKLALVSDWFAYDFVYDLFSINSDGTGFTPLTDGNIFDGLDYLWPSWAPDGSKIAATIQQEVAIDEYVAYVGVMNVGGSDVKPLAAAAPWSKTSWSSDGTMIAFTTGGSGVQDVAWIRSDGSARGTIVFNGRNAAWQP